MSARGRTALLVFLALCAMPGVAAAAVPSWTTYHHDAGRSGVDPDSASPVAPSQVWLTGLDGQIYGQPLLYGSKVYVATENDTVYALDARTGAIVWQKHLATPVPAGQLPCGNIYPTVGITSTPVIDPGSGAIYVVTDAWNGTSAQSVHHQLFGLRLSDGSATPGLPTTVDPPGSTPAAQLQRTSLALDAGKVVVGYGGNWGDCGSYHGWLVAVPESGGPLQTFEVDRNTNQGAIWASGNAPPVDSAGDLWTSTGNGSSSSLDNQESVIRLDSNLNVVDHWTPSNWSSLDSSDTDLGSSMPLLLPGGLVFQIGKAGVGYLLSATSLGGTGAAPVYQASVCSGSWGGGIYVGGVIYVTCSDGMHALSLNTTAKTFAPLPGWTVTSNAIGPPIYAAGLVWSAGTDSGVLYGLDPASGATRYSDNLGVFEHFTTPSAGGGRLFVANGIAVTAFKIALAPGATPTTTGLASSANPSPAGAQVTYTATVSPAPDGGTVGFTDGGASIAGCSAVPVDPSSGRATCTAAYGVASRHAIAGAYSGDSAYDPSSGALTQVVVATVPVISRLKATAVHRRLHLSLSIRVPAKLTVRVYRQVTGRIVARRCRAGAMHGRTCKALQHEATLTLGATAGLNRFAPRMRLLAPGRYLLTVTAATIAGRRSKTYRIALAVPAHRR